MTAKEINSLKYFRLGAKTQDTESLLEMMNSLKTIDNEYARMYQILTTFELEERGAIRFNEITEEYEVL